MCDAFNSQTVCNIVSVSWFFAANQVVTSSLSGRGTNTSETRLSPLDETGRLTVVDSVLMGSVTWCHPNRMWTSSSPTTVRKRRRLTHAQYTPSGRAIASSRVGWSVGAWSFRSKWDRVYRWFSGWYAFLSIDGSVNFEAAICRRMTFWPQGAHTSDRTNITSTLSTPVNAVNPSHHKCIKVLSVLHRTSSSLFNRSLIYQLSSVAISLHKHCCVYVNCVDSK